MTTTEPGSAAVRQAATLVLLRSSHRGPEVLLTTRPKHLRFMGGAAVFPGGATSEADCDPAWQRCSALSAGSAAAMLDHPDLDRALGAFVSALRETYEEVGLLLADGPVDRMVRADADDPAVFLRRCTSLGLILRTDLLQPAGRWVTPLGAPVRFDARFFVAEAPPDWVPEPDPNEVDRCWWTTPAEALAELSTGALLMAPPTIEMMQRLRDHTTLEEVRESLRDAPVGMHGDIISVRLSPLVHVVLAPNPGVMTGPGTNTYVVGSSPAIVIDPAVDDGEYLAAVRGAAGDIAQILVTHRHPDHVGGIAALVSETGSPVRAFGPAEAGGVQVDPLRDGEEISIGGGTLRVLHTPGHASDHLCFHLTEAASLFAGDNILGEGTAVIAPPDGNMRAYLDTLRRLRDLPIDRIYPGHFRPLDGGRAVIEGYIAHREQRRMAVLEAIRSGSGTPEEIVSAVYADTPDHLHPVAAVQVRAMLELLEEEGDVIRAEQRWKPAHVD
ncbi:MAG TPA: MBL fold metallo-hydrolase [Actinomycetota bacterium]|nr:MBL fold metallo-hydrolase [Actinomycetota bacterium]